MREGCVSSSVLGTACSIFYHSFGSNWKEHRLNLMVLFQINNDSSVSEHFSCGEAAWAVIDKVQVLFLANNLNQ